MRAHPDASPARTYSHVPYQVDGFLEVSGQPVADVMYAACSTSRAAIRLSRDHFVGGR
jgi:hypothetical protein